MFVLPRVQTAAHSFTGLDWIWHILKELDIFSCCHQEAVIVNVLPHWMRWSLVANWSCPVNWSCQFSWHSCTPIMTWINISLFVVSNLVFTVISFEHNHKQFHMISFVGETEILNIHKKVQNLDFGVIWNIHLFSTIQVTNGIHFLFEKVKEQEQLLVKKRNNY